MSHISKEQILALLQLGLDEGTVTRGDIYKLIESNNDTAANSITSTKEVSHNYENKHKVSAVELLQYIGGFIVILGIGTALVTIWDDLSRNIRVLISVVMPITFYILGVILMKTDTKSKSGIAFHLIAGSIFPISFYVTLQDLFLMTVDSGVVAVISLTLMIIYAISYYVYRHIIFTFFMLIYSIAFLYSSLYALVPNISIEMLSYVSIAFGAIGIFIAYSFRNTPNDALSGPVYFFSSSAVLLSPAFLFGPTPIWLLFYPLVLFSIFYLATFLHSKAMVVTATLALMGYILYTTSMYFSDVLGWPVVLMLGGVMFITIGYILVKYKDKY